MTTSTVSGSQSSAGPGGTAATELVAGLYTDGIIACKGAFSREWAAQMHADVMAAFEDAIGREGGAVGRGPHRYYVEIHPEQMRGFVELVSHPWARTTRSSSWDSTSRSPVR